MKKNILKKIISAAIGTAVIAITVCLPVSAACNTNSNISKYLGKNYNEILASLKNNYSNTAQSCNNGANQSCKDDGSCINGANQSCKDDGSCINGANQSCKDDGSCVNGTNQSCKDNGSCINGANQSCKDNGSCVNGVSQSCQNNGSCNTYGSGTSNKSLSDVLSKYNINVSNNDFQNCGNVNEIISNLLKNKKSTIGNCAGDSGCSVIEIPTPTNPSNNPPAENPLPGNDETVSTVLAAEKEVVKLVNEIRVSYGLSELKINEKLCGVARAKSQDMATNKYFSHTSPTYGSPFDMMKKFGVSYKTAGENIAMGYKTAQSVVDGWMNSEGHRANILNSSFTQIGVGYVEGGNYWTQMFIG